VEREARNRLRRVLDIETETRRAMPASYGPARRKIPMKFERGNSLSEPIPTRAPSGPDPVPAVSEVNRQQHTDLSKNQKTHALGMPVLPKSQLPV